MKNLYPLLAAVLFTVTVNAQSERFYYPDAFYFVKEIKVDGLQERPFHFEIAVKENPADTLSKPRIYAIQVRKGKEDLIGKTLTYATANNGAWKTYTIDGIVDKQATRIWFYTAVNGNGSFYFDNLRYSIADVNGTLEEKDISNGSFEDKKLLSGYYISAYASKDLKVQLSPDASDGKKSLQVTSTGQKPGSIRTIAKN
jgi:hypothetical protein